MKIYEILSLCNDMAKLGLPAEYFTANNQSALADERIRAMLTCCATVSEELYCDYAAAVKKCRVRAENGFIDCSKLRLCRVISLTDSMGNAAKYRYTEGGLITDEGEYTVVYAALPPKTEWDGEIKLTPRITPRIFAYGIIAEYCFISGDVVAQKSWAQRYYDALRLAEIKTSLQTMPAGRW
ncbi:MAG TPA: hypothetical protein IAC72_04025 [Candidatus Fimimonas merdipullorum]|uniref:Uncharacterized protein n=1 Tax=Candidatus Fimimonas merdipullorum TaxID=2840822 RepID=A0A9D1MXR7_9BACT|nr:hypothetical protein [Candidatus Fimimonas merdipullorum]